MPPYPVACALREDRRVAAPARLALLPLTSVIALEPASKGVLVNALAAGDIETDMHDQFRWAGLAEHIQQ